MFAENTMNTIEKSVKAKVENKQKKKQNMCLLNERNEIILLLMS